MAGKKKEPVSAMDYAEHDRTYDGFLWLTKWSVVALVTLLVAMAAGFFGGFGLIGGTILWAVLLIISYFAL